MPLILGFSAYSSPSRTGVRTYTVPGTNVQLPVRAEIAPLLLGAAREFHQTVEPLVRGWCWGYAFRAIIGRLSPSKHSAGIAIDLNAPRHPLGRRNTFSPAQQVRIRAIAKKYGLKWGGDWSRPDDMHLELDVSREQALVLVRRLQAAPQPQATHPNIPRHVHEMPVFREGSQSQYVRDLQGHLNYWRTIRRLAVLQPDGKFGPSTAYAVRVFQQAYGLGADGIVGPRTWALLHSTTDNKRLESDGRGF